MSDGIWCVTSAPTYRDDLSVSGHKDYVYCVSNEIGDQSSSTVTPYNTMVRVSAENMMGAGTSHNVSNSNNIRVHRRNHSRCDPRCICTIGICLIIIGFTMFGIFCAELLPPYIFTRHFLETTCVVQAVYFHGNICCDRTVNSVVLCDRDDIYPCFRVEVSYVTSLGGNHSGALLFIDIDHVIFQNGDDTKQVINILISFVAY